MQQFYPISTLSIQKINFERHDQLLLSNINITLHSGDILHINGSNGCGKSTLLRIIAGLIEPHQGTIGRQGSTPGDVLCPLTPEEILYIGHENGIKQNLSVYENIKFCCALAGTQVTPQKIEAALITMGLESIKHKPAYMLSAGQTRRTALAMLLLRPAPLWILDEPMTALDTSGQDIIHLLLLEHQKKCGIVILTTHQRLPTHIKHQFVQLDRDIMQC